MNALGISLDLAIAESEYHSALDHYKRQKCTPDRFGYGMEDFRRAEAQVFAAKERMQAISMREHQAANGSLPNNLVSNAHTKTEKLSDHE